MLYPYLSRAVARLSVSLVWLPLHLSHVRCTSLPLSLAHVLPMAATAHHVKARLCALGLLALLCALGLLPMQKRAGALPHAAA